MASKLNWKILRLCAKGLLMQEVAAGIAGGAKHVVCHLGAICPAYQGVGLAF